jgi:hypothetical protein
MNGRRGIIHHDPVVLRTPDGEVITDTMDPDPSEPRCMVRLLPETTSNDNNNSNNNSSNSSNNSMNSIANNIIQSQCISIKSKNMTLYYPPNTHVILFGLVGAKQYNGCYATIIDYKVLIKKKTMVNDNIRSNGGPPGSSYVVRVREPRYLVEISLDHVDGTNEDGETKDATKQILVSPKNLIHLPGQKPPPVLVLNQRLIFTGSMKNIVKVLNQSVHKLPTLSPMATAATATDMSDPMRGFHLLSNELLQMYGDMDQVEAQRRMTEDVALVKLWGKISVCSYKSKGTDDNGDDNGNNGDNDGNDGNDDDTEEGNNHLPKCYQQLQSICPTMGRIHKVCFNPKCYKIIHDPLSKQSKMKRCTKCHAVAYCDRNCALEAWDYHKKTCRIIQEENVRFADYVTLVSPQREEVMETQRMIRLCVNRIAGLGGDDDADTYFQGTTNDKESNMAKLLYDVVTQSDGNITNEILQMVENIPITNREVAVAVGFNSLGADPVYSTEDIQLFANVHDCSVTYQQGEVKTKKGDDKIVYNDIVTLEPNGEPLPQAGNMMGNIPEDVQDGFFNFMNNLMPGGMGVGGNNNGGGGGGGGAQGGAQFFMPGAVGGGMMGGLPNGVNIGAAMMGAAGGGDGQFFMPGQGGMPQAHNENDDVPEMGGPAAANQQNDGNGAANAAAAGGEPQNVPPAVANFLQHVLAEAGVGPLPGFDNAGVGGNNDNGDTAGDANDDEDEDNDNLPQVEDVADNNPNQQPQPPQQPRNFQFGGAHVHVVQGNANQPPPGVPLPGAFFQSKFPCLSFFHIISYHPSYEWY